MSESIEEKQQYLHDEIIAQNYDGNEFTEYICSIRGEERDNIDFVLSKPIKEERVLIDEAINDAVNALKEILKSNFDRAMTKFN